MLHDQLTNEEISKKFKNQFDMVNFAIKMATQKIKSGRPSRVKSDVENQVYQILEEIAAGKELLEDVIEAIEEAPPVANNKMVEFSDANRKRHDSNRMKSKPKLAREVLVD